MRFTSPPMSPRLQRLAPSMLVHQPWCVARSLRGLTCCGDRPNSSINRNPPRGRTCGALLKRALAHSSTELMIGSAATSLRRCEMPEGSALRKVVQSDAHVALDEASARLPQPVHEGLCAIECAVRKQVVAEGAGPRYRRTGSRPPPCNQSPTMLGHHLAAPWPFHGSLMGQASSSVGKFLERLASGRRPGAWRS